MKVDKNNKKFQMVLKRAAKKGLKDEFLKTLESLDEALFASTPDFLRKTTPEEAQTHAVVEAWALTRDNNK